MAGHKFDPRFDRVARAFGEGRPSYPDSVYDLICAYAGVDRFEAAADIGCGTGESLKGLRRIAGTIVGVEPAPNLRAITHQRFPDIDLIDAPAEATGLADASQDLVTTATAFHWFDRPAALKEFARILKPGGVCVPYRYDFPVILGPGHLVQARHNNRYWYRYRAEQLRRYDDTFELMRDSGLFADVEKHFVPNVFASDARAIADFSRSTSYASAYAATLDDADAYFEAFEAELAAAQPGEFEVAFDIELVIGRRI